MNETIRWVFIYVNCVSCFVFFVVFLTRHLHYHPHCSCTSKTVTLGYQSIASGECPDPGWGGVGGFWCMRRCARQLQTKPKRNKRRRQSVSPSPQPNAAPKPQTPTSLSLLCVQRSDQRAKKKRIQSCKGGGKATLRRTGALKAVCQKKKKQAKSKPNATTTAPSYSVCLCVCVWINQIQERKRMSGDLWMQEMCQHAESLQEVLFLFSLFLIG